MLTSSGPRSRSSLTPRERAQNLSLLLSMHPPSHSIGPRSCLLPRKEIRVMDCCGHEGRGSGDARFEIQKVADGVHVAVAAPAYKVNSNTAIIESDDGVVIVDTHSKPSAARVIVERLRDIAQLKADLAVAGAPAERAKLETSVRLAESYLAEVKALKPALPTIAFEQTMKLYRRDREIHLLHLGRAHTEGDVFVYLPREKVVITGDAVIGWTPFMGDGYPEDWTATLDRLAQLDFATMIMGHGDVAGRNWLSTRSEEHTSELQSP